jgi:hypothetical protein
MSIFVVDPNIERLPTHFLEDAWVSSANPARVDGVDDAKVRILLHAAEKVTAALDDPTKELALIIGQVEHVE